MPGVTAVGRGKLANALACSCGTNDPAIRVRIATGRNLRIRRGQRFLPLDAGNFGDRIGKSMAVENGRARHRVLDRPIIIEEMAETIAARRLAGYSVARTPLCLT